MQPKALRHSERNQRCLKTPMEGNFRRESNKYNCRREGSCASRSFLTALLSSKIKENKYDLKNKKEESFCEKEENRGAGVAGQWVKAIPTESVQFLVVSLPARLPANDLGEQQKNWESTQVLETLHSPGSPR